ncbi:hypothetical protein C4568_01340 [Candidatus Parcubacteria bacterium]|nr:MAG: hypothetical protein C4568_01340 [Candidatus Parcubacteria bacterium]
MLNDKDIDKLTKVFVTEDRVRTIVREEIAPTEEMVRKLLHIQESAASKTDQETFENAARDAQLSRHDGWIKQIAKKSDIKLADA